MMKVALVFMLSSTIVGASDSCSASERGCPPAVEAADPSTLMQTRVRVGGHTAGERLEPETLREPIDLDKEDLEDNAGVVEMPLGLAGIDADVFGVLQAAGDEPTEHVDGEELGFVELEEGEDLDATPMDMADDPNIAPYMEELMEHEQASEFFDYDEDDAKESEGGYVEDDAKESEGGYVEDKPKKSTVLQQAALKTSVQDDLEKATSKDAVKKHPRKIVDVEEDVHDEHDAVELVDVQVGGSQMNCGGTLKCEEFGLNVWCRAPNTLYKRGGSSLQDCAQEAIKRKTNSFLLGKANRRGWCYLSMPRTRACPEGFSRSQDWDFYFVADHAHPGIYAVFPSGGSTHGGTVLTIEGHDLYSAHNKMNQTGSTASSLMGPIEIFLVHFATGFKMKCELEPFESREDSIKCITPSIHPYKNMTNLPMDVLVYKRISGQTTVTPAVRIGKRESMQFTYATGATPALASVTPHAAGPGEIITLNAWTCSGIVEAEPVILASNKATTTTTGNTSFSGTLVDDPQQSWGHVCDPFPPIADRKQHLTNQNQVGAKATGQEIDMLFGAKVKLGARGLDLVLYELTPVQKKRYGPLDTQRKIQDFLDRNPIMSATGREIVPQPYLPYTRYWNRVDPGQEKEYVAWMTAFLKIMDPGMYEFRMNTFDAGFIKVGDAGVLKDTRRRRRPTAGWGHHGELYSHKLQLKHGWEKLEVAHWAQVMDVRKTALEIRYKGPDTQYRWTIIPSGNLRSGLWDSDIPDNMKFNQPIGPYTKYLTPAEEIPQAKLPLGTPRCPTSAQPKMVTFQCRVSTDMQPGFYNVHFNDHRFGAATHEMAQWDTGMGDEIANVRIVPVIDRVTKYPNGKMIAKGKGLDGFGFENGTYFFEGKKLDYINGSQDHLELKQSTTPVKTGPTVFGARGLLREMWMGKFEWPDELEGKYGIQPSWQRASVLKTNIEESKFMTGTGFSERITGLFTPPFSGDCRWRIQGTQAHHQHTSNQGKLYVSDTPAVGNVASHPSPNPPPPRTTQFFAYSGGNFSGSKYEDLSGWFPMSTSFGGAFSIAFTVRFDHINDWSRVFFYRNGQHDDGLRCESYWRHRHIRCVVRRGRAESQITAHNTILTGKDIDVMWTVQPSSSTAVRGLSEIYINGLLAARASNYLVPEQKARNTFRLGESKFDGEVTNFKMYDTAVSWHDAFGSQKAPAAGAVVGVLIKPDMLPNHVRFHYLGSKSSVNECAEAVQKLLTNNKYFAFGKARRLFYCYQMRVSSSPAPHGWRFDPNYDSYEVNVVSPPSPVAVIYPNTPVVITDAAHEKSSAYVHYTYGESYAFKMERRLAGRTTSTGMTGWKKFGLECKSLTGGKALLPVQQYTVSMTMKEYPLAVKLPKSSTPYNVMWNGNQEGVTKDDEAGPALLKIFGSKCTTTTPADHGNLKLMGYEPFGQKIIKPDPAAYCGIGAKTSNLKSDGTWDGMLVASRSELDVLLREYPHLHMCLKIAPKAVVNLVIKARVGTRNREQEFSVLLTDTRSFHRDRKHAASFQDALKANGGLVNGSTTGQWFCGSIDLNAQVMDYTKNPRRFWDIDYRKGPTGTGRGSPSYELPQMKILEIAFRSGVHQHGRWQPLSGEVSIDMLALSGSGSQNIKKFKVLARVPAPMQQLPFKQVEDVDTSLGWTVEWFANYRDFLGKYNYNARKADVITHDKKLYFNSCRTAWTTRRCDHYGWRATGTISVPSDGAYKFYYSNDDDMYVFVDGVSSGHLRCCSGWNRWRTTRAYNLKAGQTYKVEVHMYEYGGGDYGAIKWSKDGRTFYDATMSGVGAVANDHYVKFYPKARANFTSLKTFLGGIQVNGANAAVKEPIGAPPAEIVQVTLEPADIQAAWNKMVTVRKKGGDSLSNASAFNAEFQKCPVVRFTRDGSTYAIYVRNTPIPSNFDAYALFTENWGSLAAGASQNVLGKDMNIYSKLKDVSNAAQSWKYHGVDNNNPSGFPGISGKTGRQHHYAFRKSSSGGTLGTFEATLDIFHVTGSSACPSLHGTLSSAPGTKNQAFFNMSDTDQEIREKIIKAGLPNTTVIVINRNGMKQVRLQNAVQSSDYDGRSKASKAIDGASTYAVRDGTISITKREYQPWWRADVADSAGNVVTASILKVRITARSDCCNRQITGFDLYVDGDAGRTQCATNVPMMQGETKDVPCIATGSSIMVVLPRSEHLTIGEVQVLVADQVSRPNRKEYEKFEMMVTATTAGAGPKLIFTSMLADTVSTKTISSGSRFFPDITDYWFRMPHNDNQVEFDSNFSTYVASGRDGTKPIVSVTNPTTTPMSLFQRTHTARGQVSHTTRREPTRRWRLPARYHTEETLEALNRRILGTSARPKTWAESSSLLQTHADREQRARFDAESLDPRDDPNALRWSLPSSWGGQSPPTGATTDIVYFPDGKTGMLDMNINIRFWVLEGNLIWDMTKDISMGAEAVVVNGGTFLIGKESAPYSQKGLITLHGHWHTMKLPLCGVKTIFQTMGKIEMHGIPVATTWTDLAQTALAGATEIEVRTAVTWQPGDHIVIAASDRIVKDCRLDRRDDCEVEERYVKKVTGNKIELDRLLVYRHVGVELEPYLATKAHCKTDPALCLKTQVRAEVGLLTRNIVVKGSNYDDGSGPAGSEGYGAHLMHAERARYTYIEFHWMGQAFQMGRYPLHLHLTGLNPWSKFVGCSLHRTFNRGITVHGTHGALLQDNVLYNAMSHGYFIEDGNEHDNIFEHNLGMMTHPSYSMLVSDQTPATFWIRNPQNYFRNNHAAGSHSFGFWFDTHPAAKTLVQRQFENNTAHSNGNTGVWVDILDSVNDNLGQPCLASNQWTIGVPGVAGSAVATPVHIGAPNCIGPNSVRKVNTFRSTTTWGNGLHGMLFFETGHINLLNHRSVSDSTGLVFWGVVSDTWPDVTNNWNGPTVLHSAYHTKQVDDLPFSTGCAIGGPWDDTFFITGTNFIGALKKGGFCPCFFCLQNEGGYETRTSDLGWYDSAGTKSSPKVSWPWVFSTFFFDMDGTLTEQSTTCQTQGCYLHAPFSLSGKAGMYMRTTTTTTASPTTTAAPTAAPTPVVPMTTTAPTAAPTTMAPTTTTFSNPFGGGGGLSFLEEELGNGASSHVESGSIRCLNSLVGRKGNSVLSHSKITATSYHRNDARWGAKGNMWRSRIGETSDSWIANQHNNNQYVEYEFNSPKWITAVQTQGNHRGDQWLTFYKLECKETNSSAWAAVPGVKVYEANRDRNSVVENRIVPVKCQYFRIRSAGWHRYVAMRADVLGCDGASNLTKVCMDKPFLNGKQQDCRKLETSMSKAKMQDWCVNHGNKFWFTALSANQACCACGGGDTYYTAPNQKTTKKIPTKAAVQTVPGGTGYAPPHLCHIVDEAGGMVCERAVRLQSVTLKNAGIWHQMQTIDVQTEYGYSMMEWVGCYRQYEFSVFQNLRHMLVPPYTPKSLYDWDQFSAQVKLRAGDNYVLQWETIHNPDGYTVKMENVEKKFYCNQAPIQYGNSFYNNQTLLNMLNRARDPYSAKQLGLNLALDMYKMAHLPLLATATDPKSAGNWGYIQANTSYNWRYWYPGAFQLLLNSQGIAVSSNAYGPWSGKRAHINEKMPTRPVNAHRDGATFGFSHIETSLSWTRWDSVPAPPGSTTPPCHSCITRLEYLYRYCGFEPASFAYSDAFTNASEATNTLSRHSAVIANKVKVAPVVRFSWSSWPALHGGKPVTSPKYPDQGVGNVTIEANWEVTLDEDVDYINKLNISGVLKFADKAGCCKLVARYIFVGPLMGKLQAGTQGNPITVGKSHIILKGHPITPQVKTWFPHLASSAKWLKNKFIAVQGTLDLYGSERTRTWVKLATTSQVGATVLELDSGADFDSGDEITINQGAEVRKVVAVVPSASGGQKITLDKPLLNSYKGMNYQHLGDPTTTGLMASAVGLIGGHTVIVEGEDTEGVPMCDKSANHTCPYSSGLPAGMNLHDFAKDLRHWAKKTGTAAHPSCRPCLAVSDQAHSGYIVAMAHFHVDNNRCPKDHGVIHASSVEFRHASSISLYSGYSGSRWPQQQELATEWPKRQFAWWSDPVWAELNTTSTGMPEHLIENSAFNNSLCGSGVALSTSGLKTINLAPVKGNVFLTGGVGINGVARAGGPNSMSAWMIDKVGPRDDNADTITEGVGSNNDEGNPLAKAKYAIKDWHPFAFEDNFMSGAPLAALHGSVVRDCMLYGEVRLEGGPVDTSTVAKFTGNTISNNEKACVYMRTGGTNGISDSVVHSCPRVAVGFGHVGISAGIVKRMTILDSAVGIYYLNGGPDGKAHDTRHVEFQVLDTKIYAKADGSGTAVQNPKVHSVMLGEPMAPDWWSMMGNRHPIGHSASVLYFRSKFDVVTFTGYDKSKGGAVLTVGEGGMGDQMSDADYHPVMLKNIVLKNVQKDALLRFAKPIGVGFKKRQCIQIDCDGRRNSLIIDEDGSFLGNAGTVIPEPDKFYDKLTYVDPMGFDTMEDLIPMPARYDRFGDAIPFPIKGGDVNPGVCGGLEFKCNNATGCQVLFQSKGYWIPKAGVPPLPKDARIVATREDGGIIRLDPIFHGWKYATGWVTTAECIMTMNPKTCVKPESQHARRYGRVAYGAFGTHANSSRVPATKGPVYTQPGIYKKGCTHNPVWDAWECSGGKHRHLVVEVMDWNHMTRRWAPVSVEVNDKYEPQGGYMNILTGCAMYWPGMRLQTFHALGHVGLRHNVYFTADPPKHLRLHFQYAQKTEKAIVCVYYGIPNTLVAYVNNKQKDPPKGWTPTWDNLVFNKFDQSHDHGAYFYDRIGAETGRPGYLYTVVAGDSYVDFKISTKVILTTKITVNTIWGGWKDPNNKNNFFKKGINGLVRNIALLIGCPPSRVAILGNGTAKPGTFWNANTTSTQFAKWIWQQNQSMDRMKMNKWKTAPTPPPSSALLELGHYELWEESQEDPAEESGIGLLEEDAQVDDATVTIAFDGPGSGSVGTAATHSTQDAKDAGALGLHAYGQEAVTTESTAAAPLVNGIGNVTTAFQNAAASVMNGNSFLDADFLNAGLVNVSIDDVSVDYAPLKNNPLGWTCDQSKWGDSVCDCGCGVWDPDCDLPKFSSVTHLVAAFNNGTSALTLADKDQVAALMNWLDADGNGNGLIDGDEVAKIPSLGASALNGLARMIDDHQNQGSGGNTQIHWSGNFANWVKAVETSSCSAKLADRKFTNNIALEKPVCIRDRYWDTLLNTPTGHCALLPEMQIGSQCKVPGDGVPPFTNVTSQHLVCSQIFKIFPGASGKSAGGILGTNAGVTTAEAWHAGGTFIPGNSKHIMSKLELLTGSASAQIPSFIGQSQGFSMYFKMNVQSWGNNGEIFELCSKEIQKNSCGHCTRYDKCRICFKLFAANGGSNRNALTQDLKYEVYFQYSYSRHGSTSWHTRSLASMTFTEKLSTDTQILVFFDISDLQNTKMGFSQYGFAPQVRSFPFWCNIQEANKITIGNRADAEITDIRIWPKAVSYAVASSGHPRGQQPSQGGNQPSGVVNMNCIHSKRNTWDFVCADEVPDHLSFAFGYGSPATKQARKAFDNRKKLSEVAVCPYDTVGAKALVFKGTFGDGLTGEYFQMEDLGSAKYQKFRCNHPPFVFGLFPRKVQVDPLLSYDTDNAGTPGVPAVANNDLVIRWSGNILISQGGDYAFTVSADDAAWLAIDGRLVVETMSPRCTDTTPRTATHTVNKLAKGSHTISILYANYFHESRRRNAKKWYKGSFSIRYSGPDTNSAIAPIPTAKLGSAPLRIASLAKNLKANASFNSSIIPGAFIWDSVQNIATMPPGSCDFYCRRGSLKNAATSFKFFCRSDAKVAFRAEVNNVAKDAFLWLDNDGAQTWDMGTSQVLEQEEADVEPEKTLVLQERATDKEILGDALGLTDGRTPVRTSTMSPLFPVLAGEHTMHFQGQPSDTKEFSFKSISFVRGGSDCEFFLEGKDKTPQDCNA